MTKVILRLQSALGFQSREVDCLRSDGWIGVGRRNLAPSTGYCWMKMTIGDEQKSVRSQTGGLFTERREHNPVDTL